MLHLPRLVFALSLAAALALCTHAGAAPVQYFDLNNGTYGELTTAPGHSFMYWSQTSSPGEVYENGQIIAVVFDWYYNYHIENGSSDQPIVEWYWFADGVGGPDEGRILPAAGLAPASAAGLKPTDKHFSTGYASDYGVVQVDSRVVFGDGYSEVAPVYVPANVVPEPSSLMALAACTLPLLLRRRSMR